MMPRDLIRKYLAGSLSDSERQTFGQYLTQEDTSELEDIMAEEWEQTSTQPQRLDPQLGLAMWQQIRPAIQSSQRPWYARRWWQAAAAAVLLLGLSLGWYWGSRPDWKEVATSYGEQRELRLPDGTQAYLNSNSKLRYLEDWEEGETRQVWLQGEAFFEVADRHEEGIKFQVQAQGLTVEVLGTSFNVKAKAQATQVYLEEGQVRLKLSHETKEVQMHPGDLVTYSPKRKSLITRQQVKGTHHTSWKEGVLRFEATALAEALQRMEEVYGVQFKLAQPALKQRSLTLGVPTNDLEVALMFIEKALGLRAERREDTVWLQPIP